LEQGTDARDVVVRRSRGWVLTKVSMSLLPNMVPGTHALVWVLDDSMANQVQSWARTHKRGFSCVYVCAHEKPKKEGKIQCISTKKKK
jgi:hypothetical protein